MPEPVSLWREPLPLVLASGSTARREMLAAAGLPLLVDPANVDERSIEARLEARGAGRAEVALALAQAKARIVSRRQTDKWVLGADQTLECEGRGFNKPSSRAELAGQLRALAGRSHVLLSAASLWRGGAEQFHATQTARLTMRPLSDEFIERYVAAGGAALLSSVGGYQLEALGPHLFSAIEGDHFRILGLPLLPLLEFLRGQGSLAA